MKKEIADNILEQTEAGYDSISGKFSDTRKFFWRELEFIKDYVKSGDSVLDFGCGNGRLIELFSDKKIQYTGADVSEKLLDLAKSKYPSEAANFLKINPSQTSLPFQNDFFNAAYSIAVFHHFPGKDYRKKIADELYRTIKLKGYVIITVWNLWQRKYIKNILKNWALKIFGKSQLDWNDCWITFKNNEGKIFNRYHHAFRRKELKEMFEKTGFKTLKSELINSRTILYIGKK